MRKEKRKNGSAFKSVEKHEKVDMTKRDMGKNGKYGKGITAEKDEFSEWFTQIMLKADLADYSSVSGCLVIRPTAYAIWEKIQHYFDTRIKAIGVKNAYFPLFIPARFFEKEKEHAKGFNPEVAWVTHAGDSPI